MRGAAISTVLAYFTAAFLDFQAMKRHTGTRVNYKLTFGKPALCAAAMGLAVWGAYRLCRMFLGNALSTVVSIGIGIVLYGILILAMRAITLEEIERLPKGRKLANLLRRFRR